jgi:hypothetical protein
MKALVLGCGVTHVMWEVVPTIVDVPKPRFVPQNVNAHA